MYYPERSTQNVRKDGSFVQGGDGFWMIGTDEAALRKQERHEELQRAKGPFCARCGDWIGDETCHAVDGDYFCPDCWERVFLVATEDDDVC